MNLSNSFFLPSSVRWNLVTSTACLSSEFAPCSPGLQWDTENDWTVRIFENATDLTMIKFQYLFHSGGGGGGEGFSIMHPIHLLSVWYQTWADHRSDTFLISDLRSDIVLISDLRSDIFLISDIWRHERTSSTHLNRSVWSTPITAVYGKRFLAHGQLGLRTNFR